LDLNGNRAVYRVSRINAAHIVRLDRNCVVAAASHCVRRGCSQATRPPLAWLWLPARLSSAAERARSRLWTSPQRSGLHSAILVQRRALLFRPPRLLSRTL